MGPDNKKAISVVFDLNNAKNKDAGAFAASVAHEGSHVSDRAKLADAAISALGADPKFEKGLFEGVFNDTTLNITSNQTETTAYLVNSVVAEFLLKNEVAPQSGGGTMVLSNREYVQQSLSIGNTGVKFWDPSWARADVATVRANRSAAIAEGLKQDADYAKKANARLQ